MAKITYDELPSAAQKAYDRITQRRKVLLIIEWVIAAGSAVSGIVLGLSDGGNLLSGIFMGLFLGLLFGGVIAGFDHLGFLFKKAVKHGIGLIIILGLWYIAVFGAICMLAYLAGWVFLIIDSILFFAKKPLVYQGEIKRIIMSQQVQAQAILLTPGEAEKAATLKKYAELKEMFDKGLITEEEFNAKNVELLDNL